MRTDKCKVVPGPPIKELDKLGLDGAGTQPSFSKPKAREISHVGLIATTLESLRRRKGGSRPDL